MELGINVLEFSFEVAYFVLQIHNSGMNTVIYFCDLFVTRSTETWWSDSSKDNRKAFNRLWFRGDSWLSWFSWSLPAPLDMEFDWLFFRMLFLSLYCWSSETALFVPADPGFLRLWITLLTFGEPETSVDNRYFAESSKFLDFGFKSFDLKQSDQRMKENMSTTCLDLYLMVAIAYWTDFRSSLKNK